MDRMALLLACGAVLAGCTDAPLAPAASSAGRRAGPLVVLATTGMIADAARIVGGPGVVVTALMGPGVDPHLYQPTAGDQGRLRAADVVFYNGLHLEGKMAEIFESLAREKTVVAVSRDIPQDELLAWPDSAGMHDPHIWFDPLLWKRVVQTIAQVYAQADPQGAEGYRQRAADYMRQLDELHAWCERRVDQLAPERRVLITSHDAFHYLGRRYGFKVVALQGIRTDSEAGLKAMTDTIDLVKSQKIRAIFPETSVPKAAIERVAKDSGARLGGELYSDALGGPETTAADYAGMLRTNIDRIVEALLGTNGG